MDIDVAARDVVTLKKTIQARARGAPEIESVPPLCGKAGQSGSAHLHAAQGLRRQKQHQVQVRCIHGVASFGYNSDIQTGPFCQPLWRIREEKVSLREWVRP
jgi:hypothetical protein